MFILPATAPLRPDARRKPTGGIIGAVPNCPHVNVERWPGLSACICRDCGRLVTEPLGELVLRVDAEPGFFDGARRLC